MSHLVYADDQVTVSSSEELQETVYTTHDALKRKIMKINMDKTKVMAFGRGEGMSDCHILIERRKVNQEKEFMHLGSTFYVCVCV